jgi:hypothetical protein
LAESAQFEKVRVAADKTNRDFDRKQSIQKREFEKNNAVARQQARQEQSVGHHLKSGVKEARRNMSDSFTEKTIGKIPGIGGLLSSSILKARQAKRQEKDQDRQDKIRDKEEALLDDLRADFERRQKKTAERRQPKSHQETDHGSIYGADFDSPTPKRSRASAAGLNLLNADLGGVGGETAPPELPISGKLPSSLRPRPGEVLRKNSSPLGLVMLHNDLLSLGAGSPGGGKKKAGGKELDLGGSLLEGGVEGLGKMLLPLLTKLIPGLLVATAVVAAIGGVVQMFKNKEQYDKDTHKEFNEVGDKYLKQNFSGVENKTFKGADKKKGEDLVRQINAKLQKEGKDFALKAGLDEITGKITISGDAGADKYSRDVADQLNPDTDFATLQKSVKSTYSKDWKPIQNPNGNDVEKNKYNNLAQVTGNRVSRDSLKKYATSSDVKELKDLTFTTDVDIKSTGKKDPKTGDYIFTLTDPLTGQSMDAPLSETQRGVLFTKFMSKAENRQLLNDRYVAGTLKSNLLNADLEYSQKHDGEIPAQNQAAGFAELFKVFGNGAVPSFHHGGLAQHEMPAILRKDELVLNPAESKVYAQQKISELEGHQIGKAANVDQEDVVAALEKLISVLESKNFEPKISVSSKGGADQPVIDFNGMRTV